MNKRLTKRKLLNTLKIYQEAWEKQNPSLVLSVFTEDAVYHERVFQRPILRHEGIKKYWEDKVVKGQGNIKFKLLHVYIDGQTAIAEWEVWFDDYVQGVRKHLKEVAILHFRGKLISSLREYWACEVTQPSKNLTEKWQNGVRPDILGKTDLE